MVTANLKRFVDWWLGQLADLFQVDKLRHSRDTAIIDLAPSGAVLAVRSKGKTRFLFPETSDPSTLARLLASDPSAPKGLLVRVHRSDFIAKRLIFPAAVYHRLDEVVGVELDRETPFSDEEVYWNYSVRKNDRQLLNVDLVVVPRKRAAVSLDRARAAGFIPDGLYAELEQDVGVTLELEPQSHWRKI